MPRLSLNRKNSRGLIKYRALHLQDQDAPLDVCELRGRRRQHVRVRQIRGDLYRELVAIESAASQDRHEMCFFLVIGLLQ